jgi:2,3-bisphosphoglycerate-independent phosphoglycerate mutase
MTMKFAMVVPDGLADRPVAELGGKTPLEAGAIPNLYGLSRQSILGTVRTVPKGMYPGSDICGLSLMGYDPRSCYSGRAPLEAANLGLVMIPGEIAFRTNLVTVEGEILTDYSAGHISSEEAARLIGAIQNQLGSSEVSFHAGKMYRHILICKKPLDANLVMDPPHDFQGESLDAHWPKGEGADFFIDLMKKSRDILENHPVNVKRAAEGKKKANMLWFWGGGPKPKIRLFYDKFGVRGGVISAVDLVNGLGKYMGLEIISVPGATGYFDTDYRAKGEFAIKALDRLDFVYIHIEATDEAGHAGLVKEKVRAVEEIDRHIVGPLWNRLKREKSWRFCVAPDHLTSLAERTHAADPVPFIFSGSDVRLASGLPYTENAARSTGVHLERGHELMSRLIHGWAQ